LKINVLKRTKGLLKVEVEGEGHTFGNLMQETLLEDKTVDWAGYDQPHPLFRQSIITVRVKGEAQPEKALERASKKIRADTEEFIAKFGSAVKNGELEGSWPGWPQDSSSTSTAHSTATGNSGY